MSETRSESTTEQRTGTTVKLDERTAARVATATVTDRLARMQRDSKAGRAGLVALARQRGDRRKDPLVWSQEERASQTEGTPWE